MVGQTVQNISDVTLRPLFDSLDGMSGLFINAGEYFLAISIALSLISGIYNWWISGSFEDLVSNLVRSLIIIGPLLVLFGGWPKYMEKMNHFFTQDLAGIVHGKKGASIFQIVGEAAQKVMDSTKVLAKEEPEENPRSGQGAGSQDSQDERNFFFRAVDSIKESIANSARKLMGVIISAFVFLLSVLLVFGLMFAVFMPVAGLYIGAIFGPLILSWLPWQPLAGMSARWLSFMISNGFSVVVAMVIVKALSVTIEGLVSTLRMMFEDAGAMTIIAAYLTVLVAILAIYLFSTNLALQANNMADAMTGGASVGEGLLGKAASAMGAAGMLRGGAATAKTHGTMVKAASNVPGAIGKVASAIGMTKSGEKLQNLQSKIDAAKEKASTVLDKIKSSELYRNFDQPINRL